MRGKKSRMLLSVLIIIASAAVITWQLDSQTAGIKVTSRPITDPPSRVVQVIVGSDTPVPESVSLAPGDGITWINRGQTSVIISGGEYFSSGIIRPGEDYTFQFLQAGDYTVSTGDISQQISVGDD